MPNQPFNHDPILTGIPTEPVGSIPRPRKLQEASLVVLITVPMMYKLILRKLVWRSSLTPLKNYYNSYC